MLKLKFFCFSQEDKSAQRGSQPGSACHSGSDLRELDAKSAASIWAQLALQHDGSDRWYLEALGIGAERKWNECFDAWVKAGGKWSSPGGRDIVWRSRSKFTPTKTIT